jgi:hypothetical protein
MFPVAATRLPVNLRRLGWVALACSAASVTMSLSACGGGTRQTFFTPSRIVSFGDENSAFSDFTSSTLKRPDGTTGATVRGFTYTVQSAVTSTPVVCNNTTGALPSPPAADCGTASNGGTVSPTPTSTDYYVLDRFNASSTKLEVEGANQRTTSTGYNCGTPRIWVHLLARFYGLGFNSQCAIDPYAGAVSYATFGAKTDDVIAQIAARRGELGNGVLVTVMVGQNDILEQFNAIRATSATTTDGGAAIAELQARADRMAVAVKDIIGTGARVVLSLTPSLNNSPKAATPADVDLLFKLVEAYNERLYVRGLGSVNGRDLVGVNPDIFTNTRTRNNSYNYVTPLCNASGLTKPDGVVTTGLEPDAAANVRFCNTAGPLNGSVNTFMWADSVRFAPLGHSLIGSLAFNRSRNQL